MNRAWCSTCQSMQTITDEHTEGFYDGGSGGASEYGYTVTDLACGHELSTRPDRVGPAPGAPYAGPQGARSEAEALTAENAEVDRYTDPWAPQ